MEDGQHGGEQMEKGNEDMRMNSVGEQWKMKQLRKSELSRQRCKSARGRRRGSARSGLRPALVRH